MPARPDGVLAELLRSVELGDADGARLRELGLRLAPELPEIAGRFYARIVAEPGASPLRAGPPPRGDFHATLVDWLESGLRGPYDDAFAAKRSRIGRGHVELGLPPHHMFAAMNTLRGELDDRIAVLYEPGEARLVAKAVDKLLDIELALLLRAYQLDSEAKLGARDRRMQADRVTAIQTLSAGLAHEIRNPLNSAKLQLELLERRVKQARAEASLTEPIERVQLELERLARLLADFLAFARPHELAVGEHDVTAIVREVVAAETALGMRAGVAIELTSQVPVMATIDEARLRQVCSNLIRNAVEAIAPHGRVTVAVAGDADNVRLRVDDDGPGIPDAVRARIYEPFFTTKDAGTGLGLSIVYSIVTLHGGTVEIDSGAGGTRVHVALPRRPA